MYIYINIYYIYIIYICIYLGGEIFLQTKTMDSRYVVGATHQMRESPTTGPTINMSS